MAKKLKESYGICHRGWNTARSMCDLLAAIFGHTCDHPRQEKTYELTESMAFGNRHYLGSYSQRVRW
jgi:hypothetical protein